MAVGFLFAAVGSHQTKNPSHMNTSSNIITAFHPADKPEYNTHTEALKALTDVYLIAGLSFYDAVRSALADYENHLQPPLQCAA